ncbi:NAD(P)-binding protein, partial [Corallococcus sp. AB049A]|uniref:NAD(P)-binding protein n=1 Tax=Corallococcus sp. AB049A TaxID=2316721 RepID=UPI0021026EFC
MPGMCRALGRRTDMQATKVAVVGGGLGGLSAAALLARGGCEVTLYERSKQLGGR